MLFDCYYNVPLHSYVMPERSYGVRSDYLGTSTDIDQGALIILVKHLGRGILRLRLRLRHKTWGEELLVFVLFFEQLEMLLDSLFSSCTIGPVIPGVEVNPPE